MKEAKSPKKPLIFYYGVVLAVLLGLAAFLLSLKKLFDLR